MNNILLLFDGGGVGSSAVGIDLSFADGSLPAGASFGRASMARYYNSSGYMASAAVDTARFDTNPASLTLRGLLIEPQRQNKVTYSENISSGWSTSNTSIVSAIIAPDGNATMKGFQDNATSGTHFISAATIAFTSGEVTSWSFIAKAGTSSILQLTGGAAAFGASFYVNYDLINGVISASFGALSSSVESLGSGYYLCKASKAAISSVSSASVVFSLTNDDENATRMPSYTGSGKNIFIWGVQNETASSSSSYIPTSGAAATRAADVLSFTVPSGVSTLRYTFDDDATQDVSVSAGSYTVPANLNRKWIKHIVNV